MNQETAAGKIVLELLTEGIVSEDDELIIYTYLTQAYAVGYDAGTKARSNKKPIAQLTLKRKLIGIFESAAEASRRTKVDHSDLAKCAAGKFRQAGGFVWEYINTTNPISSETETIKSYRSGATPPK